MYVCVKVGEGEGASLYSSCGHITPHIQFLMMGIKPCKVFETSLYFQADKFHSFTDASEDTRFLGQRKRTVLLKTNSSGQMICS